MNHWMIVIAALLCCACSPQKTEPPKTPTVTTKAEPAPPPVPQPTKSTQYDIDLTATIIQLELGKLCQMSMGTRNVIAQWNHDHPSEPVETLEQLLSIDSYKQSPWCKEYALSRPEIYQHFKDGRYVDWGMKP